MESYASRYREMQSHKGNTQPALTIGKMVLYKNRDVCDEKGAVIEQGRWHMPAPANEINWKVNGKECAAIGAIGFYVIIH